MPKKGVDFKQLIEFQEKLKNIDTYGICVGCVNELTARTLRQTIQATPVGDYKEVIKDKNGKEKKVNKKGKTGGTLKRGWKTKKQGVVNNTHSIDIYNNVKYAPYVELGHRTRDHKKWVVGQFMLTNAIKLVDANKEKIIKKHIIKGLKK